MAGVPLSDDLRDRLQEMIGLERAVRSAVRGIGDAARGYEPAAELFGEIERSAADHLLAIRERIETGGHSVDAGESGAAAVFEIDPGDDGHPVSRALADVYGMLNTVIMRYAIIQPLSHRVRDSGSIAPSGTTAHVAREHTQDYMAFAGRITEMVYNAVIWEDDAAGRACECVCPSCGLGLCICSVTARSILSEAWAAAKPPVAELGLEVLQPRGTSSARAAGFMRGDVVVAVDGTPVKETSTLQKAIRDHEPHARIDFEVRRRGDLINVVAERWSDTGVQADEVLTDCIVPPGTEFFTGQAKEAGEQLKQRVNGRVEGREGLTELTPREIQVLRLVATGADNPAIGEDLGISRATVARHVSNILEKLGAANRAEAATLAAENGLLPRR